MNQPGAQQEQRQQQEDQQQQSGTHLPQTVTIHSADPQLEKKIAELQKEKKKLLEQHDTDMGRIESLQGEMKRMHSRFATLQVRLEQANAERDQAKTAVNWQIHTVPREHITENQMSTVEIYEGLARASVEVAEARGVLSMFLERATVIEASAAYDKADVLRLREALDETKERLAATEELRDDALLRVSKLSADLASTIAIAHDAEETTAKSYRQMSELKQRVHEIAGKDDTPKRTMELLLIMLKDIAKLEKERPPPAELAAASRSGSPSGAASPDRESTVTFDERSSGGSFGAANRPRSRSRSDSKMIPKLPMAMSMDMADAHARLQDELEKRLEAAKRRETLLTEEVSSLRGIISKRDEEAGTLKAELERLAVSRKQADDLLQSEKERLQQEANSRLAEKERELRSEVSKLAAQIQEMSQEQQQLRRNANRASMVEAELKESEERRSHLIAAMEGTASMMRSLWSTLMAADGLAVRFKDRLEQTEARLEAATIAASEVHEAPTPSRTGAKSPVPRGSALASRRQTFSIGIQAILITSSSAPATPQAQSVKASTPTIKTTSVATSGVQTQALASPSAAPAVKPTSVATSAVQTQATSVPSSPAQSPTRVRNADAVTQSPVKTVAPIGTQTTQPSTAPSPVRQASTQASLQKPELSTASTQATAPPPPQPPSIGTPPPDVKPAVATTSTSTQGSIHQSTIGTSPRTPPPEDVSARRPPPVVVPPPAQATSELSSQSTVSQELAKFVENASHSIAALYGESIGELAQKLLQFVQRELRNSKTITDVSRQRARELENRVSLLSDQLSESQRFAVEASRNERRLMEEDTYHTVRSAQELGEAKKQAEEAQATVVRLRGVIAELEEKHRTRQNEVHEREADITRLSIRLSDKEEAVESLKRSIELAAESLTAEQRGRRQDQETIESLKVEVSEKESRLQEEVALARRLQLQADRMESNRLRVRSPSVGNRSRRSLFDEGPLTPPGRNSEEITSPASRADLEIPTILIPSVMSISRPTASVNTGSQTDPIDPSVPPYHAEALARQLSNVANTVNANVKARQHALFELQQAELKAAKEEGCTTLAAFRDKLCRRRDDLNQEAIVNEEEARRLRQYEQAVEEKMLAICRSERLVRFKFEEACKQVEDMQRLALILIKHRRESRRLARKFEMMCMEIADRDSTPRASVECQTTETTIQAMKNRRDRSLLSLPENRALRALVFLMFAVMMGAIIIGPSGQIVVF